MADPEVKARHRAATRAAMARPEVREKCRQAILRRNADPIKKAALIASQSTPDARRKKVSNIRKALQALPPKVRKDRAIHAAAKPYRVFYPDGRIETIVNLKLFCETHKISCNSAREVLRGTVRMTQGYRFEKAVQSL